MNIKEIVCVLCEIPMFRQVEEKRLKLFSMMGQTLTYRAGERLFEKGDDGDAAFVILDGSVDVLIPTETGETSVAVLGAKEIFGEMGVLLDQPRTTAIAAKTNLKVLRLDRQAFFNMLREFPDVAIELIKVLGHRLEVTTRDLAATRG
ncbi:MAG: cyclic nucleotide-binding domain-containing protein [Pseudomonadota bacterium]